MGHTPIRYSVLHEAALDVLQVSGHGRHRRGGSLRLTRGVAEAVTGPFVPDRGHDPRCDGSAGGYQAPLLPHPKSSAAAHKI
jgi:hypothetical protein